MKLEFDRSQLKQYARRDMKGKRPAVLLVSLVFLLLTTGLTMLVSQLAFGQLQQALTLAGLEEMSGTELIRLLRELGTDLAAALGIGVPVYLLVVLFSEVVKFGYDVYCLDLIRGRRTGFAALTAGFGMLGRVLGLSFMVGIFTVLWTLAFFVPVFLVTALLTQLLPNLMAFTSVLSTILRICGYAAVYARVFRYALAPYALADEPDRGVFHAIDRSKALMEGRLVEYTRLLLSFFGWFLLIYVVIFVVSYMAFAVLIFLALGNGALTDLSDISAMIESMMGGLWAVVALVLLAVILFMTWLTPYFQLTLTHFYQATLSQYPAPPAEQHTSTPGDGTPPPSGGGAPPSPSGDDPWAPPPDSRRGSF